MSEAAQTVVTVLGSVVGAYLIYLGGKYAAAKSKEGVERTADVDAQQSALDAWKELVDPLREEVNRLRSALDTERKTREEKERSDARNRAAEKRIVGEQIEKLTERVELLTVELGHWKRLAKVIARWATTLRDQVLTLGGTVPATPEELLLIQSLDDDA